MKHPVLVQYLEKPVSREEREVNALLHQFFQALNEKTPSVLGYLFDDDAVIFLSGQNERLTKELYIQKMFERVKNVRTYSVKNLLIRAISSERAVATFQSVIFLKNRITLLIRSHYCYLQKLDGEWRIAEVGNQ